MIQRIQSIFLLLAVLLIAGVFVSHPVEMADETGNIYQLTVFSIGNTADSNFDAGISTLPLAILFLFIGLSGLISIFLFKKRMLQARLTMYNMILSIASFGLVYYFGWMSSNQLNAKMAIEMVAIFPLVAAVLFFLARRRIIADELLVKSYDRIR